MKIKEVQTLLGVNLRRILKASIGVSLAVFLGRIIGFLREITLASQLGVSRNADVAIFLLTLPDFLVNILMGGALSAIFIPELKKHPSSNARQLFFQGCAVVALGAILVVLLLLLNAEILVKIGAPGFDEELIEKTSALLTIALWVIPLTTLAGMTTSYLHVHGRFFMPAFGTFIFNSVIVFVLLVFVRSANDILALAWGIVLGGLIRLGSQWVCLPDLKVEREIFQSWVLSKTLGIRYLQALGAGGFMLTLPVIALPFASLEGAGGLSSFNYARKLLELPMGVCLGVLGIVLFPKLSELYAQKRFAEGVRLSQSSILLLLSFAIPMALVLFEFHQDIVQFVYEWGDISAKGLEEIGWLLAIGVVALPAQGLFYLLLSEFNARLDTKTPFWLSILGVLVFLPLVWGAQKQLGLPGVMVALVVVYWIVTVGQILFLRLWHQANVFSVESLATTAKIICVDVLLGLMVMSLAFLLSPSHIALLVLAVLGFGLMILANWYVFINNHQFELKRY